MSASEQVRAFGNVAPTDPLRPRRMLANVRSQLFGGASDPVRVGPYEVVRRLGAGAMGTVFEAFDPRLHRRIALKVVPMGTLEDQRRSEMLREAQALARIGHPNVVTIYDAGTDDVGVWVAMELLHGRDLQAWLAHDEPSVIEILAVLRDLGEGLVAVHDAGLVHRDVKPSNAFRSDDGRVCLVDFGLAIEADAADRSHGAPYVDAAATLSSADATPYRAAGTPAYMAPEQHRGDGATPASDQYAFCVLAWEALYGVRPFLAMTMEGLYRRKLAERPPQHPLRSNVAHDVHRVLLRGLAADPADRWSSMRALLSELPGGRTSRRRGAVGLTIAALVLVGGWASSVAGPARTCSDESPAPWTDAERTEVRTALVGDGSTLRSETWDRVGPSLDEHARTLVVAHSETCRAVELDAIDERVADHRFACLSRSHAELLAVIETLRGGEMQVVTNAAEWVAGLDDPARCTTLEPADDVRPLPPPALAEEVESLRDRLWRAKTEMRRGDLDDALATASAVLPEANGLGFASLVAESHFELGRVHRARREWDEAQSFLGAAYFEARAARNAEVEFDAAAEMIHLLAVNLWRPDEARDWLARARAADDGQSLEATVALLVLEGMILTGLEDYPGAVRVTLEAHARARELGDRHPIYLSAASALLVALNNVDRYEEAVVLARESIEVRTRMLGAEHPSLAPVLHNLGIAAWELGRADEGRAALERSVALERLHRGPRSYDVAIGLLHIGRRSMFDRDLARARATLDEACPIFEESVGVDHAASMSCTLTLGDVALAAGRAVEASAIFDRVRVLAESEIGADSGLVGLALSGKGRAELAMQRLPQARATLERAWEILARNEPQQRSIEFAEVCLALADATWRSGGSHDRALELAHAAASPLDMPRNPVLVAHDRLVDAWLRAHEGQGARE